MSYKRPWYWPVFGLAAFIAFAFAEPAAANCGGSGGMSAAEQGLLTDFLILAVKPEGDDKDYKLVEIGKTKIDAGLLGVVINTLPLDFLGLGASDENRSYDPAAEANQCRAACAANGQCRSFAYVPPNASQKLGVCHLKTLAEASYGMTSDRSVRESSPIANPPSGSSVVFDDVETSGSAHYTAEESRATPLTLRFLAPVSQVKVLLHAADANGQTTYANVVAYDAKGKVVERTGTPIASGGEMSYGHGISVGAKDDRIATVKISTRGGALLLIDGIDYARTLIAPPREEIPPPPRLPPITVENIPMPPRAVAEAPPRVIYTPPVEIKPTPVAVAPPILAPETEPTQNTLPPPTATVATEPTPAPMRTRKPLPVWLVVASIAFLLGGAGLYRCSHRKRVLTRVTTRLVSNGLDRHTISVQPSGQPDIGLRFVVRASAAVGGANTNIDLIPAGAFA